MNSTTHILRSGWTVTTSLMCLLWCLGCVGNLEEKEGQLIEEASVQDMTAAFRKAYEGVNADNFKIGQMATYEYNVRIENSSAFRRQLENKYTVLDVKDTSVGATGKRTVILSFDQRVFNLDGSITTFPAKKLELEFDMTRSIFEKSLRQTNDFDLDCDGVDSQTNDGLVYDCIKFFKLDFSKVYVDLPQPLQLNGGCGLFGSCRMLVKRLKYEQGHWRKGKLLDRAVIVKNISAKIPPLNGTENNEIDFPVLSACQRELYTAGESSALVDICQVLTNAKLP